MTLEYSVPIFVNRMIYGFDDNEAQFTAKHDGNADVKLK